MSGDVLPDVLSAGLRVVFCGTQAGAVSARRGAYYAGPGNKFWKTLFETGLVPARLGPTDFLTLPRYGIGFTDVAKGTSGPDTALLRHHFDIAGFLSKIREHRPAIVAFNGKRAAQAGLGKERGQSSLMVSSHPRSRAAASSSCPPPPERPPPTGPSSPGVNSPPS